MQPPRDPAWGSVLGSRCFMNRCCSRRVGPGDLLGRLLTAVRGGGRPTEDTPAGGACLAGQPRGA